MITYLFSSLFDSPAQTLVNTVNTEGVMGKGVAKRFKADFPAMFKEYRKLCDDGVFRIGRLHLWKGSRWILNFPTKTTWRQPSRLEYVEAGLRTFRNVYQRLGIQSVSFPPLGCGNGNLDWADVRPLMERYLDNVTIPVYIHDLHYGPEFVPEHFVVPPPQNCASFMSDVLSVIGTQDGRFSTFDSKASFRVQSEESGDIRIFRDGKSERIPKEELERAWVELRDGILSNDRLGDERARKYKSYLFPILASLPYVRTAHLHRGSRPHSRAIGLFFNRWGKNQFEEAEEARDSIQGCLFQ